MGGGGGGGGGGRRGSRSRSPPRRRSMLMQSLARPQVIRPSQQNCLIDAEKVLADAVEKV
eukprot:4912451-Amphidinium_carterae.1